MSLLGGAAMVFWHDVVAGAEEDFHDWHSHEHLSERLGVPGFLRGRRAVAWRGRPRFFILYEVEDLSVLTSPPYLARLNDPTPWTRRSLANFRGSNRTLCRVVASFGRGLGGRLLTLRLSPAAKAAADLREALSRDLLPALARRPGLVGAHLLVGDTAASELPTAEKDLRERPDDVADWVVLIEGYEAVALEALGEEALSPARLAALGAGPERNLGLYEVIHGLDAADSPDRIEG
jgi:hypothetical protein